jgi:hypothetical protein
VKKTQSGAIVARNLIPEDQTIVVIDTSPVRNLAYGGIPEWVDTFAAMAEDGYSFSLADGTLAELLTQIRSGRIPADGYERMINLLRRFVSPTVPMLPGKIDLEAIIGIKNQVQNIEEIIYLSQEGWRQLQAPHAEALSLGPSLEDLLEEERSEWKNLLSDLRMNSLMYGIDIERSDPDDAAEFLADLVGRSFDSETNIDPPMSIRMHLELRYRFRQMARSAQMKHPYDPTNERNRNDGIDVDLYKYLILPALAVVEDRGFFGSLNSIRSFQKEWFIRPGDLATRWLAGERPRPIWPTFDDEEDDS